jgi:ubiquinone/menaquinone biosynthesis C-methylase UbiE
MHPLILTHFRNLAAKYAISGPYLEIGAAAGDQAVLAGDYFRQSECHVLRLDGPSQKTMKPWITYNVGNSNDMRSIFSDGHFGAVISNAVLEHDTYFWKSLDEMKRILRPGGFLLIGVPGFAPISTLKAEVVSEEEYTGRSTPTFDVHRAPYDYWRFGQDAIEQVFFEGLQIKEIETIMVPPRFIGAAQKP